MFTSLPYGLDEHPQHVGDGSNILRTSTCAQPQALQAGDWLVTGDRVLAAPTQGGNGSITVWLTGGHNGHSIRIAARIPVALASPDSQPLPQNQRRCRESGHNRFQDSNFCARCGADL